MKNLIITAVLLLIAAGCQIKQSSRPLTGSIAVAAYDSSGVELNGGRIYLDGVERPETTPDTLRDIDVGLHRVGVKVQGFDALEQDVDVSDAELSEAVFYLTPAQYGYLLVNSDPPGAGIVIGVRLSDKITPYLFTNIEAGLHTVSVFRDSFLTLPPALDSVFVPPEDTAFVDLTLQRGSVGSNVGNVSIDFTLPDDFGNVINLHDYRGYIVHLTFFFKDCQPCMDEFPTIEAAYRDYSQYGVQIIGIDPMYFDDQDDVRDVRENLNLSFKLVMDEGAETTRAYNVIYFPTNIVVAPSGEVFYLKVGGGLTYEELTAVFDRLLNSEPG